MSWIRLSDSYIDHPKFTALSDGAFRLWHEGMAYCRKHQTDGVIPFKVMRGFRYFTKGREKELAAVCVDGFKPLWVLIPAMGYKVNDYLDWNLSKEEENQQRAEAKQRMALGRDPETRRQLRLRDGNNCRYCGRLVNWTDRRGPTGATYDHIDPNGGDTIENLVIACRGCNSKKGRRTPAEADMTLQRPPGADLVLRSDLNRNLSSSGYGLDRRGSRSVLKEEKEDNDVLDRAGRLREELYPAWYAQYRHGARLRLIANTLEFQDAVTICRTWDDARIEKLARIVLTTDDDWISKTDRSFRIFATKASWADDRLRQAEKAAS